MFHIPDAMVSRLGQSHYLFLENLLKITLDEMRAHVNCVCMYTHTYYELQLALYLNRWLIAALSERE